MSESDFEAGNYTYVFGADDRSEQIKSLLRNTADELRRQRDEEQTKGAANRTAINTWNWGANLLDNLCDDINKLPSWETRSLTYEPPEG